MQTLLPSDSAVTSIPLWLATDAACAALLQSLPPAQAEWARALGFAPQVGFEAGIARSIEGAGVGR